MPFVFLVSETFFLQFFCFIGRVTILSITIHNGQSTEGKHNIR